MVEGTATLVVDLGNSETRVATLFGKTPKGKHRMLSTSLSNRYSDVSPDRVQPHLSDENYNEGNSRFFKVSGGFICNGALCDNEYKMLSMRPSALEKKYDSQITLWTMLNAFCQGFQDIAEMTSNELDGVNVSWNVTVLLPPADIEVGAPKIATLIKRMKGLEFLIPKLTADLKIEKVRVLPECFTAYMAVLLNEDGNFRKGSERLLEETTIVFDIGSGTTDIIVIQGRQAIASTRFTLERGGNNVHQVVRTLLKAKGIDLPDSVVAKGVIDGYVKDGAKVIQITEELDKANGRVSSEMVNSVRDFFESTSYPIRTIENILICGGGAVQPTLKGIQPISEYIVQYMKRLSANISLLEIPKNEDGEPLSPRSLNILGASILSY